MGRPHRRSRFAALHDAKEFLAQPDGPQEIDVERLARALGESALVFVVTDRLEDAAAELAAAYRAQQPEGGAEGEGRA